MYGPSLVNSMAKWIPPKNDTKTQALDQKAASAAAPAFSLKEYRDFSDIVATLDPFIPVTLFRHGDEAMTRPAQRERRARILAAARTLIAQYGMEGVTIRNLREISNLSVQTIYNLAGKRAQIVEAAVTEYIENTTQHAASLDTYPNILLAIADLIWANAAKNREYSRRATLDSNDGDFLIYGEVRRRNVKALRRLLHRHYEAEAAAKDVDLGVLAVNVTVLAGATALEWARGLIGLEEFRYRLASAYGTSLFELVSPEEAASVTRWLKHLRVPVRPFSGLSHSTPS